MGKLRWILAIGIMLIPICVPAWAAEEKSSDLPWEKGYVNLGVYFSTLDSAFRLGESNIGLGVDLDVEEFLGLDSSDAALRIDAGYRFGNSWRHTLDFSWFRFDRESEKTLTEDVTLPPELGGGTLLSGITVSSVFNFDIYRLKYNYSLIMDERISLELGGGLYIMPIEFGLGEKGKERKEESITAPLPVVGLGFDVAITPKWILKSGFDVFYLEISDFEGSILNTQVTLEYRAWKHVAIGAGIDGLAVDIEVDGGTDYPGLDFNGALEFSYWGAQLYLKLFYI